MLMIDKAAKSYIIGVPNPIFAARSGKDYRRYIVEGQRLAPPPMQKPNAVVGQLARGQQVEGTVTRITEFGAFVDIGVGRDGMVHISELQPGRVQKVSDVVREGQQIAAWVKEVDLQKNRISLTMVDPNRKKMRDLVPGMMVEGTVTRLAPYGAFIDIGVEREGMLHVKEMGEGFIQDPSKYVRPGETVTLRIVAVDPKRHRIDLSMKPEEAPAPTPASAPARSYAQEAPVLVVEEDAPTYMETAMKQALDRRETRERKDRKRKERIEFREEQEDIMARTLERHRDNR
jgi:small subunit ribosomal protein S1